MSAAIIGLDGAQNCDRTERHWSEITMFESLSFEDAVKLFKQWGFQVEPGPRPEEVTLILEGPDYRTYTVYEARMLPQIAAVALRIRWKNGAMASSAYQDGTRITVDFGTVPFPIGAASLLRA